jgi:TcdA/TcdB catalytic glycosyltransferase domain
MPPMHMPNPPDLPDLPSQEHWRAATDFDIKRVPLIRNLPIGDRSEGLQDVDKKLETYKNWEKLYAENREKYHEHRTAYHTAVQRYEGIVSSGGNPDSLEARKAINQVSRAYADTINVFGLGANAFGALAESFDQWGGPAQHQSRDRSAAVTALHEQLTEGRQQIEQGKQTIAEGRELLRQAARQFETPIPSTIHLCWAGGVPGKEVMDSAIKLAQSQPNTKVIIWTDRRNLLVSDFKRETAERRPADSQYTVLNDPTIDARIDTWQDVRNEHQYVDGLDARLEAIGSHLTGNLQQRNDQLGRAKKYLQGQHFANNSRIDVLDVDELFRPTAHELAFPAHQDALQKEDRQNLQRAYQCEVGERCNYAAAADIVRLAALHDRPGLYADVDITPPIKGLNHLIDTWNGMLVAHATQVDQWNASHLPGDKLSPIEPQKGNVDTLNNPAYLRLIGAVEEHIDGLRHDATQGTTERPRYNALLACTQEIDKQARVRAAFDEWSARTKSLSDAFDQIQPITVAPTLFKMFQTSPTTGANINSILATSEACAPALGIWAREIAQRSHKAVDENMKRRRYFNDAPNAADRAAYEEVTLLTTGPGTLTQNYDQNDPIRTMLKEHFAIGENEHRQLDLTSPFLVIPHGFFPHPSTAEKQHSWLPSLVQAPAPDQSLVGPTHVPAPGTEPPPTSPQAPRYTNEAESKQGRLAALASASTPTGLPQQRDRSKRNMGQQRAPAPALQRPDRPTRSASPIDNSGRSSPTPSVRHH